MSALLDIAAVALRRFGPLACSCIGTIPDEQCQSCIAARLARFLVDVHEALPTLRQRHAHVCGTQRGADCNCPARGPNATIDRLMAALEVEG